MDVPRRLSACLRGAVDVDHVEPTHSLTLTYLHSAEIDRYDDVDQVEPTHRLTLIYPHTVEIHGYDGEVLAAGELLTSI